MVDWLVWRLTSTGWSSDNWTVHYHQQSYHHRDRRFLGTTNGRTTSHRTAQGRHTSAFSFSTAEWGIMVCLGWANTTDTSIDSRRIRRYGTKGLEFYLDALRLVTLYTHFFLYTLLHFCIATFVSTITTLHFIYCIYFTEPRARGCCLSSAYGDENG